MQTTVRFGGVVGRLIAVALGAGALVGSAAAGDDDVHRSVADYAVPAIMLVREDGKRVDLAAELNDGRPVVMNFVYTSCTTICPMSSQVFEQFQQDLGAERESVHLMSISIDPSSSTPARAGTIIPGRWPPALRYSGSSMLTAATR